MTATKIDIIRPGQRFALNGRDITTNEPKSVNFTVIDTRWFPSPLPDHRGVFFKGAMGITSDGQAVLIDFILIMFCEEVLALPPPYQH